MKRVVVTGIGLVSPLAASVNRSWEKLIEGKSGIKKISRFDVSDIPCKVAATLPEASEEDGFNPDHYISGKDQRKMDRFIICGLAAAMQAVEDSGWMPQDDLSLDRTGVLIGSGIGGIESIAESAILLKENGPRKISPFFIPSALINLISGHLSIKYGFRGPNHSVVTACSTGAHAIGDAAKIIARGAADVMIAGGSEAAVCRLGIVGFSSARALSTSFNETPEKASRPWDKDRDGFVMGEGSGILVLEEYEHAKKRGAKIYAEIAGYGMSGDANHITAPHPEGRGAYNAMIAAIDDAQIGKEEIGYINAHGTSTPLGDEIELGAVQRLFNGNLSNISMSSTKSSIGHLLGAAGSVEAIFSILALKTGILPPTLNLENPIETAQIDLIPFKAKEKKIDYALSNSFGFGGTNASLLFKKI